MQTLKITEQRAFDLYPSVSPEFKGILEDSFGKDFFKRSIIERVTSFEDACQLTGEDPFDSNFSQGTCDEIAYKKLKVIAKALMEGKKLDPKDANQKKWYPWHENSSAGFRFYDSCCGNTDTNAPVGLCVDTEEKSNHMGKTFLFLYEQYKN